MPEKHSWLLFKQWADEYGPIFRFTIGNQNNVVVSTEKIANDLLRERGGLYSSREQSVFAAELMSRNLRPLFLPYNGTLYLDFGLTRSLAAGEKVDAPSNNDTNGKFLSTYAIPRIKEIII
jgi:hypothetical protein